jgi:predicted peptidase
MEKLSFIIFGIFVTLQLTAQPVNSFEYHSFTQSNDTLPYRLLHPENADPGKNYPLILFLHGSGERGTDNEANLKYITELFLFTDNRKQFPAYVLVPQCAEGNRWAPADWFTKPEPPMSLVMDLIDSLLLHLPVEISQLYVMGLSMGGFGTWYALTRYPDKFAAAIPICGGGDWNQANLINHIPVWVFHGKQDTVVLPEQSRMMVKALKKAGGKPRYTEYKKIGHDSWTPAFKEPGLLQWLFSQKL